MSIFSLFCLLLLGLAGEPQPRACDKVPDLNQQLLKEVRLALGKKVGDGECWSLAAMALDKVHASWDHAYQFGRIIDPLKECIAPGDILQFENVVMEHQEGKMIFSDEALHHTAIIFDIKKNGEIELAEQNTSKLGRKTGLSKFSFSWVKQGSCTVFRPVR